MLMPEEREVAAVEGGYLWWYEPAKGVRHRKQKTLRLIASGSLCVWVRAGYSAAGATRAALAALAALFFSRLTFAQRFC